jgi:GTP-binding protein
VVVVNKWDLVEKDEHTMNAYRAKLEEKLAPFSDVPVIFTSNITKQRVFKALEAALHVYHQRKLKISTSELNDEFLPICRDQPPPIYKGKSVSIKYITQLPSQVPTFVFYCNLPQYIKDPYKRFLENRFRERYDFSGVPIRLFFRKK